MLDQVCWFKGAGLGLIVWVSSALLGILIQVYWHWVGLVFWVGFTGLFECVWLVGLGLHGRFAKSNFAEMSFLVWICLF